jgi:hypothetical protein
VRLVNNVRNTRPSKQLSLLIDGPAPVASRVLADKFSQIGDGSIDERELRATGQN